VNTETLPLLDLNDEVASVPTPKPRTPKKSVATAPTITGAYRGDVLSTEPKANNFITDEAYFFGFKRRTPGPRTPSADSVKDYVYDPRLDRHLRLLVAGGNIMMIGAPGSGKTTLAAYIAHHMGLEFYGDTMYAHTQGEDLLGKPAQNKDGIWGFVPAPLVYAYEHGGLVCFNEVPALKPGVATLLHPYLNRDPVIVQTDTGERTIYPHDDFRFFGTGNHWSSHLGNHEMGAALSDRTVFVRSTFLPADLEISTLCEHAPSVQPGVISDLVQFANAVRAGVEANPLENKYCPSTRMLRKLTSAMEICGYSLDEAVGDFIVQKLDDLFLDERGAVLSILKGHVALEDWDRFGFIQDYHANAS